jgi:hypothetical protein
MDVYPSNPIPSQHWSLHGSEVPLKKRGNALSGQVCCCCASKLKKKHTKKRRNGEKN